MRRFVFIFRVFKHVVIIVVVACASHTLATPRFVDQKAQKIDTKKDRFAEAECC